MARRNSSAGEFASTAAEAGGNLAGVGLGALFAGADGAVAGAVVGPSVALLLKQAVAQIGGWITGRQAERVSETIRVAATDLEQYLAEGAKIGEAFASGQSDAEDIAEGILQTVAFSYEQKKAIYLGHMLASIAVRPDISVADAHRLTRVVDQLSYRQLVWLADIGSATAVNPELLSTAALLIELHQERTVEGVADELKELSGTYGLIGNLGGPSEDERGPSPGASSGGDPSNRHLGLTVRGRKLFELLRLDSLPGTDRRAMADELFSTLKTVPPTLRS